MPDLPPVWKSFLDRARDYLAEGDMIEAQWSVDRALHYLEIIGATQDSNAMHEASDLLNEITSRSNLGPIRRKSLWQHLREG